MRVRTVVQLLSGSTITSVWQTVTDDEFNQIRDVFRQASNSEITTLQCLISEGDLEQEAYIPIRNVDVMMLEMTGDEQPIDSKS